MSQQTIDNPLIATDFLTTVRKAQNGDSRSFDELMIPYRPRLKGLLIRLLKDASKAEDVGQTTEQKALKALNTKEFKDSAYFWRWLATIATNTVLDHFRKRGEIQTDIAGETEGNDESVIRVVARPERINLIRQALARLPVKMRQALLLYMDGQPYKVIAARMEITERAATMLVCRGKRKLRDDSDITRAVSDWSSLLPYVES